MDGQTKKIPYLLIVGFLLVFGVGLAYGYFYSQTNVVSDKKSQAEREIIQARNKLEEIKSSETVAAQMGLKALDTISKDEVMWSEVLLTLVKVIPLDVAEKKPLVDFTSYSGSEGGQLTFNSRTNPSTNVPRQLDAIAQVIETFNESPVFKNAFVPSISKSVTEEEESVLSFIFNVEYLASQASEEEGNTVPRT